MNKGAPRSNSPSPDPRMAGLLSAYPAELFDTRLYQNIGLAEEYCLHLAIDVLQRLGAEPRLRQPCAAADLAGQLGLATRFRPALAWLLDRLTAAGILADAAASGPGAALRYHSTGDWPKPRLQELRQRIKEIESASLPTLDLLDIAAAAYPRIAAGE